MYNFTITNDSVTVVVEGKVVKVHEGQANFPFLRTALLNKDWPSVLRNLTAEKSLIDWLSLVSPNYSVEGDSVKYLGEALPAGFTTKIHELVKRGESPTAMLRFHERLQKNPSARSVQQLWGFLAHCNIPLTEDGCLLGYKKVRDDFFDFYSGTVKNEVGTIVEMPRNKISDDPREACHFGLHVGSLQYAKNDFEGGRGRVVIVKVDPADVVSVPYDASSQKMRVCKYEVYGHYTLPLDNLKHVEEPADEVDESELEHGGVDADECAECKPELQKDGVTTVTQVSMPARSKLDDMTMTELLEQSIDALRKYAAHTLKLVGASKIPGGKSALVKRILKVRK